MSSAAPVLHRLRNGIRVVVEPIPGAQSIVLVFRFAFGAKDDPLDRLGMACVVEESLFKGTPSRDARSVFDAFDNLGVRRGASTGVEYTEFRAQLLPRHFPEAIALYSEIFKSASFPDEAVEAAKSLTLEEIKRLEDNPIQQVLYLTYQAGLGDPMGRMPLGRPETVSVITPPGVRNCWTTYCKPERLVISVAGGLDLDEILDRVDAIFGHWSADGETPDEVHPLSVASRSVHHEKPSEQQHIGMLFSGVPRGHDLYYPGQLLVTILSGSGSSRLFTEVREKRGLAYSVAAFYRARRGGGLVALYAGTTPDRADETFAVCHREINRVAEDLSSEELERAKTIVKGRILTTGDLPEGRAGSLAEDLFFEGRPRALDELTRRIDEVTLDRIPAYLEAFPPDPLTLVTLGPRDLDVPDTDSAGERRRNVAFRDYGVSKE